MANNRNSSILWSCVARNDIILAKANNCEEEDDDSRKLVALTAHQLLQKKATPGWEFHSLSSSSPSSDGNNAKRILGGRRQRQHLKGMKFHVYDHRSRSGDDVVNDFANPPELSIWIFACVYDPSKFLNAQDAKQQIQSFLEKMVAITEVFRDSDDTWKYGSTLAVQNSFGPILQQRMDDVTYLGKMAMLNNQLQEAEKIMSRNIEMILDNTAKLETLQDDATKLQEMGAVFKKNTREVKRKMLWQNAKHGLVLGTAITTGVAVVVVPTILAIL